MSDRRQLIKLLALGIVVCSVSSASAQYCAYVTNGRTNNVSIIDTATRKVTAVIPFPGGTFSVGISPDGRRAYVADDQNVSVVDTSTGVVTATIAKTGQLATSPDGQHLYLIADYPDLSLVQISTVSNQVTGVVANPGPKFTGGGHPLSFSPTGDFLYAIQGYGTPAEGVAVIDTRNLSVTTIAVPQDCGTGYFCDPSAVAVSPNGAYAYLTEWYSTEVSIIDTATHTLTGNVVSLEGNEIDDVVFTPNGRRAYVVDDYHTVYAIDTATRSVLATITLGEGDETDYGYLAVTPNGGFVYVAGYVGGAVSVIDTSSNAVVDRIQLAEGLQQIAIAAVPGGCAGPPPPPSPTPTPGPCVGDCDGNSSVTVDEILTMVNIALGNAQLSDCSASDANHDEQITVDEILTAVNHALNGCS